MSGEEESSFLLSALPHTTCWLGVLIGTTVEQQISGRERLPNRPRIIAIVCFLTWVSCVQVVYCRSQALDYKLDEIKNKKSISEERICSKMDELEVDI